MRDRKSILFVRPDYHCSFVYRDELRRLGWKADIFVPWDYPRKLLYSAEDILRPWRMRSDSWGSIRLNAVLLFFWHFAAAFRYKVHIQYGKVTAILPRPWLASVLYWFQKRLGVTHVYLPSGCLDEETQANFGLIDEGNVCGNCGYQDRCDDAVNANNFEVVRKFFDIRIGTGTLESTQYEATHLRWKSINLSLWNPEILIPQEHRLPPTSKVRILHSNLLEESSRSWKSRNIKGTPFVHAAVERLLHEGYSVEHLFVDGISSSDMRFYQAQADIIVDQLIYGWWGSTSVEALALGKPVVCYLRQEWKDKFFDCFPEYSYLPVVEATTATIYSVLKELVLDEEYRALKGAESRSFALVHFDPERNARDLSQLLLHGIDRASPVPSN